MDYKVTDFTRYTFNEKNVGESIDVKPSVDELKQLYFEMARIRKIQESIEAAYHEDQMKSPIHLVIGQEAICVGVCAALAADDYVYSSHRTQGVYLAKGGSLNAMMAELHCRTTGCVQSRGGSMHLIDKEAGMMCSSAIVGGVIPIATGYALASQMRGEARIHVPFFGDGGAEEGVLWESLNFAALKKLPIIYLLENNFYSVYSPLHYRQPEHTSIARKAESFGCYAQAVDGTDVKSVLQATRNAIEHIKSGKGPAFIECFAYRWRGHGGAGNDSHLKYRPDADLDTWTAHCPIENIKKDLFAQGVSSEALEALMVGVDAQIKESFDFALRSPEPGPSELHTHLYSQ